MKSARWKAAIKSMLPFQSPKPENWPTSPLLCPESCCNLQSLQYLHRTYAASVVDDHVFVTVPGMNGDSVLEVHGTLEIDGAGKIMGLEIT